MTSSRGRGLLATAAVGALVLGTAACTPEAPGPQGAATAFAAALASGDFAPVAFAQGSAQAAADARAAAYEGLGRRDPAVRVDGIDVSPDDPDAATATLAFVWALGAAEDPAEDPAADDAEPGATDGPTTSDPDEQPDEQPAGDDEPTEEPADTADVEDPAGRTTWTYATSVRLVRTDDAWAVVWAPAVLAPDLADGETLTLTRTSAERADVLGADDAVLVEARPVRRIGIDKTHVDPARQEAAARALAAALELDADAFAERVAAAGDKAFVEAIVVRDPDPAYDLDELTAIGGVSAVSTTLPLAPTRAFARPLLGTVGPATAEVIEESDGAVRAGDLTGLSGLQRQYDEQLRGEPGLTVEATSAEGGTVRRLFQTEPEPGEPLRTTLDLELQLAAEQVVGGVGPASAVVAVRPSTGEVLAAASGPGGEGMSTATLGQYAPGSTFKIATALALLRSGMSPSSLVDCSPQVRVDGRDFSNFPDYPAAHLGQIPLRSAFAQSCNTAFISARDAVTQEDLIDAAGSLGLVPDVALGVPAFLGAVPADSDGTDHAATMIGQGRVLASPLGMAVVAASVGRGETVTPHLVAGEAQDAADPVSPLTGDEAAALRELMRAVVTEGGGQLLLDVPGDEVMAKTGTAQFGPADDLQNHVWMVALQGDLAVAVFVDVGEYGSTTAGPLLEELLVAAGPALAD